MLLFAFIIFLPSQFGKYLFFDFSYIDGIRVDYLALVIFFNDILIFFLLLLNFKKLIKFLASKKTFFFFCLIFVNILLSKNFILSSYHLVRLIELLGVFFIGKETLEILKEKKFLLGLLVFCLIQLSLVTLQIKNQGSLQGIFYFLGERYFTLETPAIAKASLAGVEFIRPYGTFSHPNSLAGFFLLIYVFVLTDKRFNQSLVLKGMIILASSILVFVSFSKVAIVAFLIITASLVIRQLLRSSQRKEEEFLCLPCLIAKVFLPFVLSLVFLQASGDPFTLTKRLELAKNSLEIIREQPIVGVGLGNYLLGQEKYPSSFPLWLNQPVHNLFLLYFSELGLVLGGLLAFLIRKEMAKLMKKNLFLALVILLTGFFDHYWLTLPQNRLLLFFVYGSLASSFSNRKLVSKS